MRVTLALQSVLRWVKGDSEKARALVLLGGEWGDGCCRDRVPGRGWQLGGGAKRRAADVVGQMVHVRD